MLYIKNSLLYAKTLIKWVFFAVLIGVICGIVGNSFHHIIELVTHLRNSNLSTIYFLPIGGVIIAGMYKHFSKKGNINTKRVISSISDDKDIPFVMLPLIYISSAITHLVGGSAGREGAALQIGGCLGYNIGKVFKLEKSDINVLVMAGMSATFTALFGTPFTATIFTIELIGISVFKYKTVLVCTASSICGFIISALLGFSPVRFEIINFNGYTFELIFKSIIIAIICSIVSMLFCISIKKTEFYAKKAFKNDYIRGFVGGALILGLSFLTLSRDYNGAGMDVIERALSGEVNYEAFILKIIFTALTVAAGFKGGEIVPAFFVGSTLGCILGFVLGIDPGLSAAIGFVSLFCGITKCPIASILLSVEVFGVGWTFLFSIVSIISYVFSGKSGILKNKKDVQ